MDIQIRKFKTFFQLISTLIIVFVWISVALSDVVLPTKSNAEEDGLSFIISTGRAALNTPEETDLARRRALEDALYLASLEGGAKINGYSAIDSGTNLTENFVVRTTTKILDYAITKKVIKETHYEVTIKAAVGNLSENNCSNNNILNLTAYKPILSLDSAAPSWLAPILNGLVTAITRH